MLQQISVHSWKYCRKRSEVESGSHRFLNLVFVEGKIFLKLIGNDITKDLENVLGIFFCFVVLGDFVFIWKKKKSKWERKKGIWLPLGVAPWSHGKGNVWKIWCEFLSDKKGLKREILKYSTWHSINNSNLPVELPGSVSRKERSM